MLLFFPYIFGHFNEFRLKINFFHPKASDYFTDSPDQLNEPVMHFAQIGPPRNLTVQQTDIGDEFVASWYV